MQVDRVYKQLKFYSEAKYKYCYEVTNSTNEDVYLNCSSVYFYTDRDLTKSLLGDALMLINKSKYTDNTPIKHSKLLNEREVAITRNVANQLKLSVGSKVYSKHNIKNTIEEYEIVEILPVSYGVLRVDYTINYGIILLGNDEEYVKNTDYSYVGFSEIDPTSLIKEANAGIIKFNYKEPAERQLGKKAILCQCLIFLMVALIVVLYVALHLKNQKGYYDRLLLIGCPMKHVRKQIALDILVPGIMGTLVAFLSSTTILSLYNFYFSFFAPMLSTSFCICLLVGLTAFIIRRGRNL